MARPRRKITKLMVEDHPEDYFGPPWLTLVHYINGTQLVVVDTIEKNYLWGYNFDSFGMMEQKVFTEFMNDYWEETIYGEPLRNRIPVHEWLYDKDLGEIFGGLMAAYNVNNILRVVGPVGKTKIISEKTGTKRRKRVLVQL